MEYKYILVDNSIGTLDSIFVKNSQLIQNLLQSCGNTAEIPILDKSASEDTIKNVTILLHNIEHGTMEEERRNFLRESNVENIAAALNFADFCDIKLVRELLIDYFAELVRKQKSIEDLEALFKS